VNGSPEYFLVREVADKFRVDPRTVLRWISEGKLRATRTPGGRWRIPASAVEALLGGAPGGGPE
jgi:putative resolvase